MSTNPTDRAVTAWARYKKNNPNHSRRALRRREFIAGFMEGWREQGEHIRAVADARIQERLRQQAGR